MRGSLTFSLLALQLSPVRAQGCAAVSAITKALHVTNAAHFCSSFNQVSTGQTATTVVTEIATAFTYSKHCGPTNSDTIMSRPTPALDNIVIRGRRPSLPKSLLAHDLEDLEDLEARAKERLQTTTTTSCPLCSATAATTSVPVATTTVTVPAVSECAASPTACASPTAPCDGAPLPYVCSLLANACSCLATAGPATITATSTTMTTRTSTIVYCPSSTETPVEPGPYGCDEPWCRHLEDQIKPVSRTFKSIVKKTLPKRSPGGPKPLPQAPPPPPFEGECGTGTCSQSVNDGSSCGYDCKGNKCHCHERYMDYGEWACGLAAPIGFCYNNCTTDWNCLQGGEDNQYEEFCAVNRFKQVQIDPVTGRERDYGCCVRKCRTVKDTYPDWFDGPEYVPHVDNSPGDEEDFEDEEEDEDWSTGGDITF